MKETILTLALFCVCGCSSSSQSPEITPDLTSSEGFTRTLEARWPVHSISTFCSLARRHNNAYQTLVAIGEVWKGKLHDGKQTGFDEISWYATVKDGHIDEYCLGASKGEDFWVLEGGDASTLRKPPEVTPDPNQPWFIGQK